MHARAGSRLTLQTFTFIGVSTGQSAATRLFPAWTTELGLGDVRLVGCDLPIHAPPDRYREVVARIKTDEHELGGLVTTHKIDVFEACRDLFDVVDDYAQLCGETSCLAKRNGQLWAFATDPISCGRALAEFYSLAERGEVLCLGAGGWAVAITVHLRQQRSASHITGTNDRLIGDLPAGSLVINATGMGKDTPGSPITEAAIFPERGYVWELNYRGELEFLYQAQRQQAGRHLRVEDGWRYFIHGWAAVMERVFAMDVDGEKIARLARVSESERPKRG
ncbi:MAG: shikimate dehydrogenase [Chloroflexi bacterium]|nr:MAG: shikimate dehydrogenase [Chloroflexota bacterium]